MCKKVESLTEFLGVVTDTFNEWDVWNQTVYPWFRGQENAEWDIIPSLYRRDKTYRFEREMYRDFSLKSTAFLGQIPETYLEWLFIMQHYGIPTRLVDWTGSCLVALYFAIEKTSLQDNAAVWILDPWSLNSTVIHCQTVPDCRDDIVRDYEFTNEKKKSTEYPIAIRPCHTTPRIVSQHGFFTLHGINDKGLGHIRNNFLPKIRIEKIIIDAICRGPLVRELFCCGISRSTLFPELAGLSEDIRFRYSTEFYF